MTRARSIAIWECRKQDWIKTDKVKLILECWFFWGNKRVQDCSNRVKVLEDALQGVVYVNDCMLLTRVIDFDYDIKNPRVEIIVRRKD